MQAPGNEEIRQATDDQWNKFKALYPAIFFAFSFILHHHKGAEIIQRIALTHLNEEPDCWTKESWLQRKAMLVCNKMVLALSLITLNKSAIN
ncbi:hypothetical protein ABF87_02910 [Nitrosomonas sp. JL21]|nr:hypothetical protein [Nitrosomonas sp. JL21]